MFFAANSPPAFLLKFSRLTAVPASRNTTVTSPHFDGVDVSFPVAVVQIRDPQTSPFFVSSQKSQVVDLSEFFDKIIENSVPAWADVVCRSSTVEITIVHASLATSFGHSVMGSLHNRDF